MTDPTPTDWRALCAELLEIAEMYSDGGPDYALFERVLARARAALAQPEPQGPTDEELHDLWDQEGPEADFQECRRFARAVLTRWGRPAIEPVPEQTDLILRSIRKNTPRYRMSVIVSTYDSAIDARMHVIWSALDLNKEILESVSIPEQLPPLGAAGATAGG
jgi:hypothetical protein